MFSILFLLGFNLHFVTAEVASSHTGGKLKVCDKVTSYETPPESRRPHKLFLGGTENSNRKFSITIWPEDLSKIEINPVSLVGKNVCASGDIKAYTSKRTGSVYVQITVRDLTQMSVDWDAK